MLIEDNKADVFLLKEALKLHNVTAQLHVVEDGEAAIRFIDRAGLDQDAPLPCLVLLDLNLPKKSGRDVLAHIRRSKRCSQTPVLILTSSDSASDREEAARLGAERYFRKPSSYAAFLKVGEIIRELLPG